jgi:hypothetical protein
VRVALDALPEGVQAQVEGLLAVVTYGDPEAPTVVSVAVSDGDLILFPERSYKHADLAKAIGPES